MRITFLKIGVLGGLLLLGAGLFNTQILKAGHYRSLSEHNRIRLVPLEAPRGRILDRAGRLLAASRPSYQLVATPEDVTPEVFPELARILGVSEAAVRERMASEREYPFAPVVLAADIPKELLFRIEELRPELPGVSIQTSWIRSYPYGSVASHIVGYLGKISPEEFQRLDRARYGFTALLGRTGIEKTFDSKLRGWRGGQQIEVNARGEKIQVVAEKAPVPGDDVALTIDLELQKRLTELTEGKKATLAFLDLRTGELLALVSNPGFDPNVFVSPRGSAARLEFLESSDAPLILRGTSAAYPPGSVFKLVTALAGLESGKITPHTTFNCPGSFRLNNRSRAFRCWREEGHGRLDLYHALEQSCNVYFYNVGRLVGVDTLAHYSRELGFGQIADLELTHLATGLVPDSEWKKSRFKEPWYPGETLSFAVGQSFLLVSPLQVLRLTAMIAQDGIWTEPKLVQSPETEDGDGSLREPSPVKKIAIRKENLKVIRQGMLKVVESDFGTGQLARVDFGELAAKTGTAQAPPREPHAWITGFFPYREPQIAFVLMIEHGGSGGIAAAKLMKQALQIWKDLYASQMV